jgi:hypothetical protein
MDLFGEKKYEELDLLTKMIEPVTWSVLDILGQLPDKVEIPHEAILLQVTRYRRFDFHNCWEELVLGKNSTIGWQDREFIRGRFSVETSDEVIVNLVDQTVQGKAYIVKSKSEVSEAELIELLKMSGWRDYYHLNFDQKEEVFARLREILDLFGTESAQATLKKRTMNQLTEGLFRSYRDVMHNNRWNIRSIDLSNKVCRWMSLYIEHGNLAAMRNFCLLKAATHRGYPIYEIDEEQV